MIKADHKTDLCLMLAGAALTALTLVFPSVGFLQWITMIPLFLGAYRFCSDEGVSLARAYRYGFLTVFVYYFIIYHWFVRMHPLDFVGLSGFASLVVVIFAWLGLSFLQAVVGGLIFWAFRLIDRTGILARCPLLRPFVFSALWVVFEWSSTLTWTGVPWGRLCLGQIEYLPILQSASVFGSYFISFLILLVNGLLALALLRRPMRTVCWGLSLLLFVSNFAFGLLYRAPTGNEADRVSVAVVQGNINSHDKWSLAALNKTKQAYGSLTKEAAARGAELVIWSETAFPYDLNLRTDLKYYVSNLAKELDITLAVGALYQEHGGDEYNALYLVDPDGTIRSDFYAKRHLVPFGEYVPMQGLVEILVPPLADLTDIGGILTPGEGSALFETEYGSLGSLICFDTIYEQLTLETVRDGAELIMVASNDSWFFDSAAVYQHQAQSQLRAIECGRYVLRSANTGISSIIAPDGSILAWVDPLIEGCGMADVMPISENTVYTVIGNLFVYLCLAFVVLTGAIGAILWRIKRPDRIGRVREGVTVKE